MRRPLGHVALCACLLGAHSANAGGAINGRFVGPYQAYQRVVARIILNRMLATPYRTPTGGTAVVALELDRRGTVTRAAIRKTSGSPVIDALALGTVPVGFAFLPLPASVAGGHLSIDVPLKFGAWP